MPQCATTSTAEWWEGPRELIIDIVSLLTHGKLQVGKAELSALFMLVSQTANYAISVRNNCEWLNGGHNGFNNGGESYNYRSLRSQIYKPTRQQQEDASVIGKMGNKKFCLGGNIIFPTIYISDRSAQIICIQAASLSLSFKDPT